MEIWKPVKGFENEYEVSNIGRVKSLSKNRYNYRGTWTQPERILRQGKRGGYCLVALTKNLVLKTYSVHRLIAESFIPNPENKPEINHINGIKHDNQLSNLEWCTHSRNMQHAAENNLFNRRGEKQNTAKLKNEDVLAIRSKYKPYKYTSKMLAKEYNVCISNIERILSRQTWNHI